MSTIIPSPLTPTPKSNRTKLIAAAVVVVGALVTAAQTFGFDVCNCPADPECPAAEE